MALIKCKKCGKEISDKAKQCVKCGANIEIKKTNSSKKNLEEIDRERQKNNAKNLLNGVKSHKIGTMIVIAGIILALIISYVVNINTDEKSVVDRLLGTWISQENGSILELEDYGLCVVRPRVDGKRVDGWEDSSECNYEIDEKTIKVKAIVGNNETITVEWTYNDDITKLITATGTIYTRKEYENKETSNDGVANVEEKEEYQYRYHTLYRDKNGKTATIRFLENGICETNFGSFGYSENPSGVMRYTVNYISNSCTYEKISRRELKIFDNTIISRTATSGGKTVNMGNLKLSSSYIIVEFDEKYEKLKITNGDFDYTGSPSFLEFTANKDNEDKTNNDINNSDNNYINNDDNNNNSHNNNNNNDNVNDNNNSDDDYNKTETTTTKPSMEELAKKSKEKLDKATVKLKHYSGDTYKAEINAPGFNYLTLKVKIGNREYDLSDYIELEYENIGSNCVDIELIDQYNNTRTINKCINFNPESPNYEVWIYDISPAGACTMKLKNLSNGGNSYNNIDNLTCTFDTGKTFKCSSFTMQYNKKGTLTIKNKYGMSQEIPIECKK